MRLGAAVERMASKEVYRRYGWRPERLEKAKQRRKGAEAREVRAKMGTLREEDKAVRPADAEDEDGSRRRVGRVNVETV